MREQERILSQINQVHAYKDTHSELEEALEKIKKLLEAKDKIETEGKSEIAHLDTA
jgi:hypothetical protein